MWAWLSRVFRSTGAAERAEADGRVDDAVRLYLDAGDRAEAARALLRAAQTAEGISSRRDRYARAFQLARVDELRDQARRGLADVTLAEFEAAPPRSDDERRRLSEAARELEALGAPREAARAWGLLDDRDAVVRALTAAGDIEQLERVTDDREAAERHELRRRAAMEGFESLWRSGDRPAALDALRAWARAHVDDHEARRLLDERGARVLTAGRCGLAASGERVVVVGRFPAVVGREGDVAVRGASVSRRHCEVAREGDVFVLRDAGGRAGTSLDGLPVAGALPLRAGQRVSLGADLTLAVEGDDRALTLRVEHGMDRGRRFVLCAAEHRTPLGALRFEPRGAVFSPDAPVLLDGQRVALPFVLAAGDRLESGAVTVLVDDGAA